MFPSSHRCNLSKLPHESETSRGCGVKSLRSMAQFSSVSESVRAPGSSSSSVKWQDVLTGSHRCVFSCVEVISLSLCEVQTGDAHSKSLLMCAVGPRGQRLSRTCPSDRHISPAWQRDTLESARKMKRRMTRKCSCQIKAFASLLLYYDMLFG